MIWLYKSLFTMVNAHVNPQNYSKLGLRKVKLKNSSSFKKKKIQVLKFNHNIKHSNICTP